MAEAKKTTEKMVKVKLPRERGKEEAMFVSVNERTWLVKRGIEVEVPECVAEVIRNAELMEDEAYAFNSEKSSS